MPIIPLIDPPITGLVSIGPVSLDYFEHGNPTTSMGAGPDDSHIEIGGYLSWTHVKQLRGLVRDAGGQVTIDGATGVLERIEFAGLFAEWSGMYVITGFVSSSTWTHTMNPDTAPFTLSATYLEDQA